MSLAIGNSLQLKPLISQSKEDPKIELAARERAADNLNFFFLSAFDENGNSEYKLLFDAYLDKGDLESAERIATKLNYLNYPHYDYGIAFKSLFDTYLDKGNLESAERIARKLHYPQCDIAFKSLFDTYLNKGDLKTAECIAIKLNYPENNTAFKSIFDTYLNKGDIKTAERIASKLHYPLASIAFKSIFETHLKNKEFDKAIEVAMKLHPFTTYEDAIKKIAKCIQNEKDISSEQLEKIESSASSLWQTLRILILEALLSIYKASGNSPKIELIQKEITRADENIKTSAKVQKVCITTSFVGGASAFAYILSCSKPASIAVGAGVAATIALGDQKNMDKNLLGLFIGAMASSIGYGNLPSVAAGLATAVILRKLDR